MKRLYLKENEKAAIAELKKELLRRFDIFDFCIFGSKARGDASPESDIDLMIEVEDNNPDVESEIDDVIFEINLAYDCFISATIFGRKELKDGPFGESPLYKAIEFEGVRV